MFTIPVLAKLITTALLFNLPAKSRPLWSNATDPTACVDATPSSTAVTLPLCTTLYPSEYRVMNSRYPSWDQSPLHGDKNFFMLLRQRDDTFQVASQVQFYTPNTTNACNISESSFPPDSVCRLQFQLPNPELQTVVGPEPVFNVYQVEREAGAPAFWNTYDAGFNSSVPVFVRVNGTLKAQEQMRNISKGLLDLG